MGWREMLGVATLPPDPGEQYPHNPQNRGGEHHSADIEDIADRIPTPERGATSLRDIADCADIAERLSPPDPSNPPTPPSPDQAAIIRWLDQNHLNTDPNQCAHCGRPETSGAVLLPFGGGRRHTWLHADCWSDWFAGQTAAAVDAVGQILSSPEES